MRQANAFTLFEVVLALAFMGSCMVFFLRWQGSAIRLVSSNWNSMIRLVRVRDRLSRVRYEDEQQVSREVDEATKVSYIFELVPINQKSALASFSDRLRLVSSRAEWAVRGQEEKESVSCVTLAALSDSVKG